MNAEQKLKIEYLKEKNHFENDLKKLPSFIGTGIDLSELDFDEWKKQSSELSKFTIPHYYLEIEYDLYDFERVKKLVYDSLPERLLFSISAIDLKEIFVPIKKEKAADLLNLFKSVIPFGINFFSLDLKESLYVYQKERDFNLNKGIKEPIGEIIIKVGGLSMVKKIINNKNVG